MPVAASLVSEQHVGTMQSPQRRFPAWLPPAFAWGTVVVGAIALGLIADAPDFAPPGGARGRMLPRIPPPPSDVPTLLYQLGVGSVVWYAAAIALPLLVYVARRVDLVRQGAVRAVLISLGMLLFCVAATAIIQYASAYGSLTEGPGLWAYAPVALRANLVPWLAVAGLVTAVEARRRSVQARVESERLRAQVAEQRLVALTGQLQPHFLFNTLQGISTLIHRDPNAADEMLGKLGDLLREVLRHRDHVLVPLADEMRYARTLLDIAQVRFADRLRVSVEAQPDVLSASVPLFILQPLIENALSHGIGRQARGGEVAVKAWRQDGRLHMTVEDDGAGLAQNGASNEGIGLSNTRERLRASFGDKQRLTIEPRANGSGVIAHMEFPFQPRSS
ncbi:MAG: histidine kinase [Gemmatimonadota bacterium]